jgi:hypothetical protein
VDAHPEAWFSALGTPLGEGEADEIRAYLEGLGVEAALPALLVGSWGQAETLTRGPAGSWWDAEETERARLERLARVNPADAAWLATTEKLHGAAAIAAARSGIADPGLIRAAAGAATYAAHQHRLARAAGMPPGHPFMRKYALFCGGRWPLGVYGDRFAIF